MDSVVEEWRPVPGFEGYEASTLGRIRSVPRSVEYTSRWGTKSNRQLAGKILKTFPHGGGYRLVTPCIGGKHVQATAHAMVAAAFLGERPEGMDVNHIDGDKANNVPSNLEYVTRKDNMRHARETGLWDNRGEKNGQAKATEAQIRQAHALMCAGASIAKVVEIVGLTRAQIRHIRAGDKWLHLGLGGVPLSRKRPQRRGARRNGACDINVGDTNE